MWVGEWPFLMRMTLLNVNCIIFITSLNSKWPYLFLNVRKRGKSDKSEGSVFFPDVSTRLSPECCDRLLSNGDRCARVLLDVVRRCIRSLPHMEVIVKIFDILINLSR